MNTHRRTTQADHVPSPAASQPVVGIILAGIMICSLTAGSSAAETMIQGQVFDLNGRPLPQVQIIYDRAEELPGASVVTVYSGADGRFTFPGTWGRGTGRVVGYFCTSARLRATRPNHASICRRRRRTVR